MAEARLQLYVRRRLRGRTYTRRLPLRRRHFRKSGGELSNTAPTERNFQCERASAKRSSRLDEKPCEMHCNILMAPFTWAFIMPPAAFAWSSMMKGKA